MLSLGIIASSFQTVGALNTFSTGVNIAGPAVNSLAFVDGTAVFSSGGTGSRYSTAPLSTSTLGGASIDTPNASWGANGVVLKTGRNANGTVTIARTTNGGQTWGTALDATRTGDRIETVAYADVSGTARWIAPVYGDNDVYLSTNNGSSFTEQSNVLGGTARNWVASTRMGSAFAVFNQDITAYYTSEIGTTWTLRTLPSVLNNQNEAVGRQVASSDDTTMVITGGSVVLTTSDLVSWSTAGTIPVGAPTWDAFMLTYGSGNWVVAAPDSGTNQVAAWTSSNNGNSWTQMTVQGSGVSANAVDAAYNSSENAFYIVLAVGTANRIWRAGA